MDTVSKSKVYLKCQYLSTIFHLWLISPERIKNILCEDYFVKTVNNASFGVQRVTLVSTH